MDHQPPPFFKRGPAPLAQLSFYAMISLALIFIDSRFQALELVRQGVSLFTHPLQQAAQAPLGLLKTAGSYLSSIRRYQEENAQLRRSQLENSAALQRTLQLEAENERLRKLLDVRERQKVNGRVAQILYAARDPFSRRVIVNKGQQDQMVAGQPVIDDAGIVGQVTRVFPFVSEVTLITDKEQAVPVQVVRNGLRSVVYGLGDGLLELRFLPANVDIENGDVLVTSGLDGVFPQGFPVAQVVRVERDAAYSFARISCAPAAAVENFGEVLVIDAQALTPLPKDLIDPLPGGQGGKSMTKKKRLRRN